MYPKCSRLKAYVSINEGRFSRLSVGRANEQCPIKEISCGLVNTFIIIYLSHYFFPLQGVTDRPSMIRCTFSTLLSPSHPQSTSQL